MPLDPLPLLSKADIQKWLNKKGVPWWPGKKGEVCTTLDAVTHALEQRGASNEAEF